MLCMTINLPLFPLFIHSIKYLKIDKALTEFSELRWKCHGIDVLVVRNKCCYSCVSFMRLIWFVHWPCLAVILKIYASVPSCKVKYDFLLPLFWFSKTILNFEDVEDKMLSSYQDNSYLDLISLLELSASLIVYSTTVFISIDLEKMAPNSTDAHSFTVSSNFPLKCLGTWCIMYNACNQTTAK